MTRGFALLLVLTVILANAGVTCLYSGAGPTSQTSFNRGQTWNPAIEAVANLLTLPLPTAGSADVRDVVLPIGLGIVLLLTAVRLARAAPLTPLDPPSGTTRRERQAAGKGRPGNGKPGDADKPPAQRAGLAGQPSRSSSAQSWLLWTALGVTVLSLLSAAINRSFDLSWGWIVRFVAGAGWAVIIARTFSLRMARHAALGLLAIGLVSLLFSIAYSAERDLAYYIWPIGPITITGALAAVWAALAAGLILSPGRSPPALATKAFLAVACLVSLFVVEQAGRRAPAMGLVFAALVAGAMLIRLRYPRRITDAIIAAVVVLAVAGAAAYVVGQVRSRDVQRAGPVALRFEYWRLCAGLVGKHPLLGTGPDTLIVELTNLVAPLRAYEPHVYHGSTDPYAHNEWLQAATELGLPAGILYLAIPVGIIVCGIRRLYRRPDSSGDRPADAEGAAAERSTRAMLVALIAGLVAIMVLDSASITLRGPIMPLWYWTLLGLLAVLCDGRGKPAPCRRNRAAALLSIVAAAACFAISATDVSRAEAEGRRTLCLDTCRLERLWAEKTLPAESNNAFLALDAIRARPDRSLMEAAKRLWQALYRRIPGQTTTLPGYAMILIQLGETVEAQRILEEALSPRLDPFNGQANFLYARLLTDDPVGRLRCAQRSLRSGALDDRVKMILADTLSQPAAMETLEQELLAARQIASAKPDRSAAEPTVELLRISAYAKEQAGSTAPAIADQRLAADFYRRLEQEQNPYRRRSEAEVDAFYTLARMLYTSNSANYREAYDAIGIAEKYAVLGTKHEAVAHPRPQEGLIGGEVILTEFPENLRPLWRLSSLLHVEAGDERHLMERVLAGLPPDQLTDADIRRELTRLYRQACADLTKLPEANRPAYYTNVCNTAQQFETGGRPKPGG
ncbi:MAG TPA: O-antigen ligase family protein [Phycisphaerae bacterium]|nr:O-antigen ligase family protein [Phycisphaerae bacterium]